MNVAWQRSFELSFSVERVFQGYVEFYDVPPEGTTFTNNDVARSVIEMNEVARNERIAWTESKGDVKAEHVMVFESTDTGTRITVTRYGFGEGDEFEAFNQSNPLGWEEGFRDLAVYLETGLVDRRHLRERSATGMVLLETESGLRVVSVRAGGLGAEAGLQAGDILLSIDGAALYERSDIWFVTRLYEPGREVEVAYARAGGARKAKGRMAPVAMAVIGELGLGPREASAS